MAVAKFSDPHFALSLGLPPPPKGPISKNLPHPVALGHSTRL